MYIAGMLPAARERLATTTCDAPLIDAAKLLSRAEVNLVVVCDSNNALVGVITRTDVVRQISCCAGSSCTTAVASVMTRDVTCCRPADLLTDVWSTMKEQGLKNVPIVDESTRPLGVLYARDALRVLLREVEYEELLLRDYVMGVGYR
jgi:CBS domain-containing protein